MRRRPDLSLVLVTDRTLAAGRSLEDVVRAAVRGGVTAVQLREKDCSTRQFLEIGRSVQEACRSLGVPFIVNDRADLALVLKADGIHIGQDDLPPRDARRLLGPDAVIGLSVETLEQALAAEAEDVDYLGISPIFATPTKPDTRGEWDLAGLSKLRRLTRRDLVAIGGINPENAGAVIEAGADGIAVVSAICAAADPERAARDLRKAVDGARTRGSR
ncbi:MAG: thiamine phosphate synthase [Candidatus Aminicenantes bacterium]|nr:thiamine phosphate synthase [Candidatus Aminicenantes bacterium]